MDKDIMPKLELDGFTYETRRLAQNPNLNEGWTSKAAKFAKSAQERLKNIKFSKTDAKRGQSEPELKYRRLLIKTGACAVIAVVILGIASVNTQNADAIKQAINSTVNHEFDMDQDIGKLKFVDNLNDETESVFSPLPDAAAVYPAASYNVVTAFGKAGSQGVRLKLAGTQVLNIAKGTVDHIGKINGSEFVQVKFDTGETAYYYGIEPSVKLHDIVTAGQAIGNVTGDYLYVELKRGGACIDPMAYIEQREAAAVKKAS